MAQDKLSLRAQEMHAHIQNYLSSGLTQQQFCEKQNLPRSTFTYWLQHFRKYSNSESSNPAAGFIPLQLKDSPRSGFSCRICYPNGVRIDFEGVLDGEVLLSLIKSANG
jgi:hypothetical protein